MSTKKKKTGTQMPMATTAPRGRLEPGSDVDRLVGNVLGGFNVKTSDGTTEKGVVVDGLVMQAILSVFKTGADVRM